MPWGERTTEAPAADAPARRADPVVAPVVRTGLQPVTVPPALMPEQWAAAPNSQILRHLAPTAGEAEAQFRGALLRFVGRQEGRLMALVDNVVDVVISAPYLMMDGVDAAVDAVAGGLPQEDRERLRDGARAAFVTAAPLWEKLREQAKEAGLYDESTRAPSVKPLVTRAADSVEAAVLGGAPPERSTLFTDRELGQLQGEIEGQAAMALIGAKELKLALDALDGVGSVTAVVAAVREARRNKGDAWLTDRNVWFTVLNGLLTVAGLMDVSAGRKLLQRLLDGATYLTPIAQAAADLSDSLTDPDATDEDVAAHAKDLITAVADAVTEIATGRDEPTTPAERASTRPAAAPPTTAPPTTAPPTTAPPPARAAPAGPNPGQSVGEQAAERYVTGWKADRTRPGGHQGSFGPAFEAANEAHLEAAGHRMRNLNELSPNTRNSPTIDLWGTAGAVSDKVVGLDDPADSASRPKTVYAYLKELRGPNHEHKAARVAALVDRNRQDLVDRGDWPADLATTASEEEITTYILRRGTLSIPASAEELAAIRDYLRVEIGYSPGAVGLPDDASPEQIEAVVESVVSGGITRESLNEINRRVLELD